MQVIIDHVQQTWVNKVCPKCGGLEFVCSEEASSLPTGFTSMIMLGLLSCKRCFHTDFVNLSMLAHKLNEEAAKAKAAQETPIAEPVSEVHANVESVVH